MLAGNHVGHVSTSAGRGTLRWHDAWRPFALAALAAVALVGYSRFAPLAPAADGVVPTDAIVRLMLGLLLPYGGAMALLLLTPGPRAVLWRRVEGGILALGAVAFRVPLLFLRPQLSPDAYRYAWDARLIAHGLSPYLHGPDWPGYAWLRDRVLYPFVPWPQVPSIYPPGAQFFYWLAGLVAPGNVYGIKVEMTMLDLLAGGLLALLLARRGADPRRAAIYLWAPLPIVEFALNGHEDAIAIVFILVALLLDTCAFRGVRVLVGVALGIATLVKLYPLLLAGALYRRWERAMPAALALVLLLGYARYLGEGPAALGFLSTYLTQVQVSYGGALLLIRTLGFGVGASAAVVRVVGALLAGGCVLALLWLRLRPTAAQPQRGVLARVRPLGQRLVRLPRPDAAATACGLIVIWLAFSPHVFPWYATALLPFVALLPRSSLPLTLGIWLFASFIPLAYIAYNTPSLFWLYPALYITAGVLMLGVAARRARGRTEPPRADAAPVIASIEKGTPS